jgi:hypothetical protein
MDHGVLRGCFRGVRIALHCVGGRMIDGDVWHGMHDIHDMIDV